MDFLLSPFGAYLFIFSARVIDMTLDVIRILMLMRDRRVLAAFIGFCEVSIFVLALNQVLSGGLNDPGKVIAYAGGFATGNFCGSLVEHRMAIGFLSMQIFPHHRICGNCMAALRDAGFGVTSVIGEGRQGQRSILFVTLKRKDLPQVLKVLDSVAPDTFYTLTDARNIRGGVFPMKRKGL